MSRLLAGSLAIVVTVLGDATPAQSAVSSHLFSALPGLAIAGLLAIDSTFGLVGGPSVVINRVVAAFSNVDELAPGDWIVAEG